MIDEAELPKNGLSDSDPRRTLDDLIARALAYRTGPELKELLTFSRRFPQFAPYNAMLLHVQNPHLHFALRAAAWENDYGRRVKSGARPYVILRTMGPVQFVFDVADTEAIDPNGARVPALVTNPFPAKGEPPPLAMTRFLRACAKAGIEVEMHDLHINSAGNVSREQTGAAEFRIRLNMNHSPAQQLGSLAHEVGHIFCGHLGPDRNEFAPVRSNVPREGEELEAEAVAYLVTDRLNLDIGSVAYLSGYLGTDKPIPTYSLDAVLKAAGRIEEMISGKFRLKKKKPNTR